MSKPKNIQITIPHPCSKNWDEMTPAQHGRFCAHCQKTVIDFSTWSDTALYNFFSKDQGHVCGRFLSTQVDRKIAIPYQPHSRLYRIAIAMGLTLMFTQTPQVFAQNRPPKTEQASVLKQAEPTNNQYGEIRGQVLNDKKEPLISAAVQVYKDGVLKGGNVTDYDGNYTIKPLEPGNYDVLVTYTGYDSNSIKSTLVVADQTTTQNFRMNRRKGTFNTITILGGGVPLVDRSKQVTTEENEHPKKLRRSHHKKQK